MPAASAAPANSTATAGWNNAGSPHPPALVAVAGAATTAAFAGFALWAPRHRLDGVYAAVDKRGNLAPAAALAARSSPAWPTATTKCERRPRCRSPDDDRWDLRKRRREEERNRNGGGSPDLREKTEEEEAKKADDDVEEADDVEGEEEEDDVSGWYGGPGFECAAPDPGSLPIPTFILRQAA
uniref:Uncharacterized protein n=1 Tax=Leersia perrieri TaxID=77586 RepID=A0A0D9VEM8_9ORYZ